MLNTGLTGSPEEFMKQISKEQLQDNISLLTSDSYLLSTL